MAKSLKVAIIGCGRISGHHCRSIVETKGIELAAVCDLLIEKANNYSEQFGAKAYDNYHQMLQENPQIDTVAVITPSGMHYEHALDIISRYQKHIIVEKPTFLKPSHVSEVYKAASEEGVQVFAVFQNRHNLAVKRVEQGLTSGELGQIRCVSVRVRWCRPQQYYDMAPWRGTYSMDGGCLTNQGIHHIDLLRRLGGEVRRVCCLHKTLGANIEVEDTGIINVKWRNGALGSMCVTMLTYPKNLEGSITILGEKGTVRIGGVAVNDIQHWEFDKPKDYDKTVKEVSYQTTSVYGFGHPLYYNNVIEVLRGNAEPETDGREGLRSLEVLIAAYLSARDGKTISLPLEY